MKKHKLLAILLALTMILSILPATAMADETDEPKTEVTDGGQLGGEEGETPPEVPEIFGEEPLEPGFDFDAATDGEIRVYLESLDDDAYRAFINGLTEGQTARLEAIYADDYEPDLLVDETDPAEPVVEVKSSDGGETKTYATFAEAYENAADGDTITLLQNTDWTVENSSLKLSGFAVKKNFVLDLHGHTLNLVRTGSSLSGFFLDVQAGGSLTIKDSGEGQGGKLSTDYDGYLVKLEKGNMTLESGTLEAASATRTVYLHNQESIFTMTGGTLINGAAYKSKNSNVLEVSSGKAVISGGALQSTNENPVPCARVSGASGSLEITGGTFITSADKAVWVYNNAKSTLKITGGDFSSCGTDTASLYVNVNTPADNVVIGTQDGEQTFTLPKLALNGSAAVTVCDNAVVGNVVPTEDTVEYFSAQNVFGGKYKTDFSQYIRANGYKCVPIDGEDGCYQVVLIDENDESEIVAVITDENGSKKNYYDFGAAMTALQNGETLTLKQDVVNEKTSSYKTTVTKATIQLDGHSITASNASYGLWIWPAAKNINSGDTIQITGTGKISAKQYGVYADANGSSSIAAYTVDVADTVDFEVGAEGTAVYLNALARLKYQEGVAYDTYTNAKAKTTIDGVTYLYQSVVSAINDQPENGGTVTLLGDCAITGNSTAVNAGKVVLDLAGYQLSSTSSVGLICNGTELEIQNGTFYHAYKSASAKSSSYAISMTKDGKDGAKLTLDGVVIQEETAAGNVTAMTVNGSLKNVEVTLKNCTVTCADGEGASTVGVYFPVDGGKLNITDTKITAMNAVQVKGGTVTVRETEDGGTEIKSTGAQGEPSNTSSGCTNTGDGIYVEDTYGYNPTVSIESGTVTSANAGALNYFDDGKENASGKIEVSGGHYSNSVIEYVVPEKRAELKENSVDAPYSYYSFVDEAAQNASAQDTVTEINGAKEEGKTYYQVTFLYDDTKTPETIRTYEAGNEVALLTPSKSGYDFDGWYDGEGKKVSSPYTPTADVTLTAHWTAVSAPVTPDNPSTGSHHSSSSSVTTYPVTVDSAKHGTVTASAKNASRGTTVTITVKPDDGYELDGLTVTDKDGKTVKVTEGKNGKFTFTMPASKVTIEADFAKTQETPDQRFTDVPEGYWAEDEINWTADNGYMNGNTATTFNPEGSVTRQQLWMILARLSGYRPADFAEARAWAVDNGISDGSNPENAVTRQQLVTILYRYAVRMGYKTTGTADLTAFPDHASVAAYATDAMSWSVANGIVGGTSAGTLNPAGTATRAQFAVILYRFCEKVVG